MYTPPFTVSAHAINRIADISAMMERFAIRMEQADALRLRKENRIKTIHSSLAIEGNCLTESQVTDILEGKPVIAPLRDIQEVKNAIATYDLYASLNPFDVKDLLCAHGTMMMALIDDAGRFRSGGVGVFGNEGCVHLAPPPQRVPELMGDLFDWLRQSEDHLLIRSCVFHYEFEFIHPFSDGNGRTGRLWQSLILGRLNPLFAHLPVENMVHANQQAYYDAINASTKQANSGPFIDFMLDEIYRTLESLKGDQRADYDPDESDIDRQFGIRFGIKFGIKFGENDKQLLLLLNSNPTLSAADLAKRMGISSRSVEKIIKKYRELGVLSRRGSLKNGLWEINANLS